MLFILYIFIQITKKSNYQNDADQLTYSRSVL